MEYRSTFDEEEWRTLEYAPLWIFTAVAATDGKVLPTKAEALAREIAEASLYKNPLVREVLASLNASFTPTFGAFQADGRGLTAGLGAVADLLEAKVAKDVASGFKLAVFGIGLTVARVAVSTDGKLPEGERLALAFVALQLRMTTEDLGVLS